MPKIGRNDPCPCGSGKKYKQCHLPIEEAAAAEQLRLRRSVDTLIPKIIMAAQTQVGAIPAAFDRFWDGKYTPDQLEELDDLEGRGGERFLTWFAFDYPLEDGRTLVEQLAAGTGEANAAAEEPDDLDDDAPELTAAETQLLREWVNVRLRPYVAQSIHKGQGLQVRDLLDERIYEIVDQAASRRVELDEVLVAHLVPAGTCYYIGGAAAHLTEDTRVKLREFAELQLEALREEQPAAGWDDMIRTRSGTLNHFVMQLPVEAPDPTLLDNIVTQTRISLKLAGESLGIGRKDDT